MQGRALFLDRDGVINADRGFVHTQAAFDFLPGIFDLCRRAHAAGYLIIVCTNQSGIGRGLFSESQFIELTEWMKQRFAAESAPIEEVYFCPFHPEEGKGEYRQPSLNRKPAPGMFLKAWAHFNLNMQNSIAIGDSERDAEAAHAAGVGTILHLGERVAPGYAHRIATMAEAESYIK